MRLVILALLALSASLPYTPAPQPQNDTEIACIGGRILKVLGGQNRRERRQERRANAC